MKKGVSLLVLAIAIIVVAVLAATLVLTLANSKDKDVAEPIVQITNIKEVEQLAASAWATAYASGERNITQLELVVDNALVASNVDKNRFEVTVTATGVIVIDKTLKVEEVPDLLEVPTLSIIANKLVITDLSGKADRYVIYVNGIEKATTTVNSVALDSLGLTTGTYNITIRSTASGYEDSDVSTSISYSVMSFVLGATTYYTRTGSTWMEWVSSAYNTVGATTSGDIVYVGGAYVTRGGSIPADATSLINSGATYGLYLQGGITQ